MKTPDVIYQKLLSQIQNECHYEYGLRDIIKKFNKWSFISGNERLEARCSGWKGQVAVVAQQHFLHLSEEKARAKVSEAPGCSAQQQYDGSVSWRLNVLCCTHTHTHTPDTAPIKSIGHEHSCPLSSVRAVFCVCFFSLFCLESNILILLQIFE